MTDEKKQNNHDGKEMSEAKLIEKGISNLEDEMLDFVEVYGERIKGKVELINGLFGEVDELRKEFKGAAGEEEKAVEDMIQKAKERLESIKEKFRAAVTECAEFAAEEEIKTKEKPEQVAEIIPVRPVPLEEATESLRGGIKGLDKLAGLKLSDQSDQKDKTEKKGGKKKKGKAVKLSEAVPVVEVAPVAVEAEPTEKTIQPEPVVKSAETEAKKERKFPVGKLEVGPYLDLIINQADKSAVEIKSHEAVRLIAEDFDKVGDNFLVSVGLEFFESKIEELKNEKYKTPGEFKENAKRILKEIIDKAEGKTEVVEAPPAVEKVFQDKEDYLSKIIAEAESRGIAEDRIIQEIKRGKEGEEFRKWLGGKELAKLIEQIKSIKKIGATPEETKENFYSDLRGIIKSLSDKFFGVDLGIENLDAQKEEIKKLFYMANPRNEVIDFLRELERKGNIKKETLEFVEEGVNMMDSKLNAENEDDFFGRVKNIMKELREIDKDRPAVEAVPEPVFRPLEPGESDGVPEPIDLSESTASEAVPEFIQPENEPVGLEKSTELIRKNKISTAEKRSEIDWIMSAYDPKAEIDILRKYADGVVDKERARDYPNWQDEDFGDLLTELEIENPQLFVYDKEDTFAGRQVEAERLLKREPAEAENAEVLRIAEEERLKQVLEEKRRAYVKAKKDYEKKDGVLSKVGRFFSRKKAVDVEANFAQAEAEYKQARAEYVGAEVIRALGEKTSLVDAQILEDVKTAGLGEKTWARVRGIYKKLGDLNLESKMKDKPKSWLGKMGARMLSVRTAINAGLVGVGFATGGVGFAVTGAARAGMRFIGTSGFSYDLMKNAAIAKEEKSGLLADLSIEDINNLSEDNLNERLEMIEARCCLDGVVLSQSKYTELYNRLQDRLRVLYGERVTNLDEILDESDKYVKKNIKEQTKIKNRHKIIALSAGVVSASGLVGKAIKNVAGGVSAVKDWITGGHAETHDVARGTAPDVSEAPSASVSVEEVTPKVDFTGLSPQEVHSQLEVSLGYDAVAGKGEGITHVIYKDIAAHPEKLQLYAEKIPEVRKLLDAHNGNVKELFSPEISLKKLPVDTRKILFDIYKNDFNDSAVDWRDALHIKEPEKVAVVFDGERYRLGATDGSDVEDKLYLEKREVTTENLGKLSDEELGTKIKADVGEMVGGQDELTVRGRPDLRAVKEYEETNFSSETAEPRSAERVEKIVMPVDLPKEAKIGSLEEMAAIVEKQKVLAIASDVKPDAISGADEAAVRVEEVKTAETVNELAIDPIIIDRYEKLYDSEFNKYLGYLKNKVVYHSLEGGSVGDSAAFGMMVAEDFAKSEKINPADKGLIEILGSESRAKPEEMAEAVRINMINNVTGEWEKEADLLLNMESSADKEISVEPSGCHAIKLTVGNKDYFILDKGNKFSLNETGNIIATDLDGKEHLVDVDMDETPPRVALRE